ncbi:iron-sulfur protein [Planomonospora parontospora subsp. parontospora]|uniref:Cytochrome bc1 complex Rieske iron-sulfur subunit n=2 Tax=Planomonospora parontospora TaxID=58119 RepID=A0AA37BFP4_9ACTN|nr:Rieske (2Fe-2S) protein [Planomonospora parontospora]GGK65329.1 iron-sulfur protein [Planomonospora parontospora]GII08343.1 iron-sulfur protein [Planomonospora parontospora subsp. parontospora]
MTDTTRRAVMLGAGGAGLAAVLTACSGYGEPTAEDAGSSSAAPSAAPSVAETGSETAAGSGDSAANALAKTSDIPVGGGEVFKDAKVVVTQPKAGEFKCFSSVCTHQGCDVGGVEGTDIVCPCHNSRFSITDGSVTNGPANKPLEEKAIKVDGDSITLA